ncbi:hypothetical protein D9613_001975 [Agrocybe pediades]|uniref:Uncharacterized protein n=1 Tax=Agrocybe pediades TaxID=84607 RepID=A0A8H4R3V7_9AGAR|nr:hypothetical protein D9613_001975 [Agrocybe pediades]
MADKFDDATQKELASFLETQQAIVRYLSSSLPPETHVITKGALELVSSATNNNMLGQMHNRHTLDPIFPKRRKLSCQLRPAFP